MFGKIDTVHMTVTSLERSRHWYEEKLELKQVFDSGTYKVFKLGTGETTLTLQEGEVRPSSVKPILFSDALEETRLKLVKKGVEASEVKMEGEVTYFEFWDPDGNGFEVCHYMND
ncbi:VOC family protein [Bacillus sp. KH172YL63]|uniref:VOC family protein n=1 Tax=Bacillus sp. KH172YL63 TaxID=2709784 RepID=UPI0013E4B5B9|nr:VOC family protein [Bacillus sp. KH172YL63]BCB04312.1 hypothetical protein KH172YL63_24450 [Bacillus sp. KH172YL63]